MAFAIISRIKNYLNETYITDSLRGLNAVCLGSFGWYRVDAGGNKAGVEAACEPPVERLAFNLQKGESDVMGIFEDPLPSVIEALKTNTCYAEMVKNFPDI